MSIVGLVVLAAVVVGWVRGGRLSNLSHVRLTASWLVVIGFLAQLVLVWLTGRAGEEGVRGLPLLVVSQLALLGFFWANRLLPGMPTIFAGFAMNAAVILANGAMPVSRAALTAVSGLSQTVAEGKHRLLVPGDPLPWLADVIPLPLLRTVVSVGDVVLAAGIAILVTNLMTWRPASGGRRSRAVSHAASRASPPDRHAAPTAASTPAPPPPG